MGNFPILLKQSEVSVRETFISPYIFIMCVEYIGRYIHFMSTIKRSPRRIWIAKVDPNILYLMFVDDYLVFQSNQTSWQENKMYTRSLLQGLVQLVNYHKSKIQFPKGSNTIKVAFEKPSVLRSPIRKASFLNLRSET